MNVMTYSMLIGSAPLVIVYIIALIVALANLGRWPRVCRLVLIASAMLLVTTFGQSLLQGYLIQSRGVQQFASMSAIIGIVASLLRAGAFALLVWAAFVDRSQTAQAGFETLPPPMAKRMQ